MPRLLARGNVGDYAKWKPAFDKLSAVRKKYGAKGGVLLRDADNPNEVTVLMEWDNLENARKYVKSDELKKVLQMPGVKFEFHFLDEMERVQA